MVVRKRDEMREEKVDEEGKEEVQGTRIR